MNHLVNAQFYLLNNVMLYLTLASNNKFGGISLIKNEYYNYYINLNICI